MHSDLLWIRRCHEEDLAFRAACNEAVEPSARPLKRRVIRRLATSPDARAIWEDIDAAASSAEVSQRFALLAADARWRTLVLETTVGESRWGDLREGTFDDVDDRLHAIWEKLAAVRELSIASAASLALVGGLSIAVTLKLVDEKGISLPVRLAMEPSTVQMVAPSSALQLKFEPPASIPLTFTPSGVAPIPLTFVPEGTTVPAAPGRAGQVALRIGLDASTVLVLSDTNGVKPGTTGTSGGTLGSVGASLSEALKSISTDLTAIRQSSAQSLAKMELVEGVVTTDLKKTLAGAKNLNQATGLALQQSVVNLTLTGGASQPLGLRWIGTDGTIEDCLVGVRATLKDSSAHVVVSPLKGCPGVSFKGELRSDLPPQQIAGVPFEIALDRIAWPAFGPRRAVLRITRG